MVEHPIRIDPVRRHYNRWVRNQILEDYALRFTAVASRRWSCAQVASTAIGAGSFLALEAIGAAITYQYGFTNAITAIAIVSALIFLVGLPIAYHAARAGTDIDLLTRGAGFGYLGSTVTSLIYASFTFIFFAIEAAIMASALELCLGLPLFLGYLVSALVVIPIVLYGITLIGRFQRLTQPLWIVLQLAPFVAMAWYGEAPTDAWRDQAGHASGTDGFALAAFGAASAVVFSLVAQIGEQADYLRFLPERTRQNRLRWWAALLVAGPGWIVIGALKMLIGSFLVVFALQAGTPASLATEPVHMYLAAWNELLSPELALSVTALFVIVCQTKINVTNAYAGSIAWSNFFSRLTHNHPGRVVWVVFNVAIALLLMELGLYRSLERTLSLYSIVAVAWIGALASDLAIARPLGLSPADIEFKRAHLYDVNPVGTGAMLIGAAIGLLAYLGHLGIAAEALAGFIALGVSVALVPVIARLTDGRYHRVERTTGRADEPVDIDAGAESRCVVCEHAFEPTDMTWCPAYAGGICSLCCTLDNRCEDRCRPGATLGAQLLAVTDRLMPRRLHRPMRAPIVRYLALLGVVAAVLGFIMTLVFLESATSDEGTRAGIERSLVHLYAVLLIIAGVVTWIFLLISDSRRAARRESAEHNASLMMEIAAHERTERALQAAKDTAVAANQAKSRYLLGLSHELRSPLNAILGYARLIETDEGLPPGRLDGVRVIQHSANHLADLIEGLLDVSRIEAGRFTLNRERVELRVFLARLADMFRLQAQAKGLDFVCSVSDEVPAFVRGDGQRLRQVLINLLSNALKNTERGEIGLCVDYRSEIARFAVNDTGIGIAATDLERIFEPFETVQGTAPAGGRGTGLGLTITRLLSEVMGGELTVKSEPGKGSVFTVRLSLSSLVDAPGDRIRRCWPIGHIGRRRHLLVVDDDPDQRALMSDVLEPLGFRLDTYADAESCLSALDRRPGRPDACLLDIALPGMDGWTLADRLRSRWGAGTAIITLSAGADSVMPKHIHDSRHENHFVKPADLDRLLERLGKLLGLDWTTGTPSADAVTAQVDAGRIDALLDAHTLARLRHLSRLGHVAALRTLLESIRPSQPHLAHELLEKLARYQLGSVDERLRGLRAIDPPHSATNGTSS